MFEHDVAGLAVRLLTSVDLLINCPGKRLSHEIFQVSDSLSVLRVVHAVVCVYNTYKVLLREAFKVVEQLFNQLEVLMLLSGDSCE